MNLTQLYKKLLEHYKPQGWWPINGAYSRKLNLTEEEKFEICIGAILTQNTNWSNVEQSLKSLRDNNSLSFDVINDLKEKDLAPLITSAGFFNQKAKTIKTFTNFLRNYKNISEMFNDKEIRNQLLSLKGFGKETVDSMLLYAGQLPYFVIDSYTRRVLARFGLCDEDIEYTDLQEFIVKNIPKEVYIYQEFHALIVALAKDVCVKYPDCESCILNKNCKYGKSILKL